MEALPGNPLTEVQGQVHRNDLTHWRRALDLAEAKRTEGARLALSLLPALVSIGSGSSPLIGMQSRPLSLAA